AYSPLLSFPTRRSSDLTSSLNRDVLFLLHLLFFHLGNRQFQDAVFKFSFDLILRNLASYIKASGALSGVALSADVSSVFVLLIRSEEHTSELQSRFDIV